MTTVVTPSKSLTDGQIDKAVANYRAMLEKHREDLMSEPAQLVLGQAELGVEMFGILRRRVDMLSKQVVRRVKVDRARAPDAALKATGRKLYITDAVVEAMPRGEGEEAEVVFFKPEPDEYDHDGWMSDEALDRAYEKRGLKAADPYSVAAVNEADPAFADEKPHGIHWKNAQDKWCCAIFYRWDGERKLYVHRGDHDWNDNWLFAGLRK